MESGELEQQETPKQMCDWGHYRREKMIRPAQWSWVFISGESSPLLRALWRRNIWMMVRGTSGDSSRPPWSLN